MTEFVLLKPLEFPVLDSYRATTFIDQICGAIKGKLAFSIIITDLGESTALDVKWDQFRSNQDLTTEMQAIVGMEMNIKRHIHHLRLKIVARLLHHLKPIMPVIDGTIVVDAPARDILSYFGYSLEDLLPE